MGTGGMPDYSSPDATVLFAAGIDCHWVGPDGHASDMGHGTNYDTVAMPGTFFVIMRGDFPHELEQIPRSTRHSISPDERNYGRLATAQKYFDCHIG
jgi:hypothetical protein